MYSGFLPQGELTEWVTVIGLCCCGDPALVGGGALNKIKQNKNKWQTLSSLFKRPKFFSGSVNIILIAWIASRKAATASNMHEGQKYIENKSIINICFGDILNTFYCNLPDEVSNIYLPCPENPHNPVCHILPQPLLHALHGHSQSACLYHNLRAS